MPKSDIDHSDTVGGTELSSALFPFQRVGVQRLLTSTALLLADDMGLGKTVQAIAALRRLAQETDARPALIVMPAGLITQWRDQIYTWWPEATLSTVQGTDRAWRWHTKVDVYLVSYETLRQDFSTNPASPLQQEWGVVVLDEASRIKNRDTEASRVCKALRRARAWALTGTPLENRVDDLASILDFVQPNTDAAPAHNYRWDHDTLFERLGAVQLRRRKVEVLDQLPPKTVVEIPLELGSRQRASYDRAEHEGIVRLKGLASNLVIQGVLDLIIRLKQICNFCPESGESVKFDDLETRLNEISAQGNKALVFSQFVQEPFGIRTLERRLAALSPIVYSGDVPADTRPRLVERFKRDAHRHAMLISLRAGGQGLNLQEANYVFHFDRWWNPAIEHQAEDRAHRLGQEKAVTVYSYVCTDTIEERINEVLKQKGALFSAVVDGDESPGWSRDELLGLFGLN